MGSLKLDCKRRAPRGKLHVPPIESLADKEHVPAQGLLNSLWEAPLGGLSPPLGTGREGCNSPGAGGPYHERRFHHPALGSRAVQRSEQNKQLG